MPNLKERLQEDVKNAMRAADKPRLGTLRLLQAAIKQVEIDSREAESRTELDDAAVLQVINKMLKQRKDSISQFQSAGRTDLVEKEEYEVTVLMEYLPAQLTEAEVTALIKSAMAETGACSMKDMGKVMALVKPQAEGKADIAAVSGLIKKLLE